MLASKREYHADSRAISVTFDLTEAEARRRLGYFRAAFGNRARTERLAERLTVLHLYPGVPEVRV